LAPRYLSCFGTKESMCSSKRMSPGLRDVPARRFGSTQRTRMASGFSKAPICSSLRAGRQTPTESDSSRPESNSTSTVISRSTRGCRLPPTISGRWAIAPAAPIYACPFDDFRVVYDNLNGGNRTIKNRLVPFCMFTDPELARVGRNESEARRDGIEYRVAKMRTADVLRTRTVSEPRGFLKMLIGANSDEILGFTAFG